MLFLATVVLLVGFVTSIKDDAVATFLPPSLRYTTCGDFTRHRHVVLVLL